MRLCLILKLRPFLHLFTFFCFSQVLASLRHIFIHPWTVAPSVQPCLHLRLPPLPVAPTASKLQDRTAFIVVARHSLVEHNNRQ